MARTCLCFGKIERNEGKERVAHMLESSKLWLIISKAQPAHLGEASD